MNKIIKDLNEIIDNGDTYILERVANLKIEDIKLKLSYLYIKDCKDIRIYNSTINDVSGNSKITNSNKRGN